MVPSSGLLVLVEGLGAPGHRGDAGPGRPTRPEGSPVPPAGYMRQRIMGEPAQSLRDGVTGMWRGLGFPLLLIGVLLTALTAPLVLPLQGLRMPARTQAPQQGRRGAAVGLVGQKVAAGGYAAARKAPVVEDLLMGAADWFVQTVQCCPLVAIIGSCN